MTQCQIFQCKIPCYNEPDVSVTLENLALCQMKDFCAEVILIINAFEHTSREILSINKKTFEDACKLSSKYNNEHFQIIPLLLENLPGKQTGAGIPRKIGMDEAIKRFERSGNENGIIVSLDADCLVEKNYLSEINKQFKSDKQLCSATIRFHHPIEHLQKDDPVRIASIVYEKYLHYYKAALAYCGYPYAYYTIGSAFAVRAKTYVQAGGMVKHNAGEDFYFLQKVFPLGKTTEINTTVVYPAARLSDRVPFGTGPSLIKMIEGKEIVKYTYCMESFHTLKIFFSQIDKYYKASQKEIEKWIFDQPDFLQNFLETEEFNKKIDEINQHTSNLSTYRKRFFNYFNAFKILKYLNYTHPQYFEFILIDKDTILDFKNYRQ